MAASDLGTATRHSEDRETDAIGKLFAAFVRRADEGTLSRLLIESTVLLATARANPAAVLREAAATYRVDTGAIALKVKQEFAAKEIKQTAKNPVTKSLIKATNKTKAA
jgi:ParB family chromosome partitioning protein